MYIVENQKSSVKCVWFPFSFRGKEIAWRMPNVGCRNEIEDVEWSKIKNTNIEFLAGMELHIRESYSPSLLL